AMAQIGMQVIGKVHRRRTGRQLYDPRLRRHDVNTIGRTWTRPALRLRRAGRRAAVLGAVLVPGQQLTHPGDLLVKGDGGGRASAERCWFIMTPEWGNGVYGEIMHVSRTDLKHEGTPLDVGDYGMQRSVGDRLGPRNIVDELNGDRRPQGVRKRQYGI